MAKKLTARQRKARKRAAYIKAEYYKNVDAIRYLERFGVTKDIKIPKKITKKSLESIRRIYKEVRSNVKEYDWLGYVDLSTGEIFKKLPTKAEAVKEYRTEQKDEQTAFNPDQQYIDELKERIETLTPLRDSTKTTRNYEKNVTPKLEKAKDDFGNAIDEAISRYGLSIVADSLAKNKYMQRVANLEEKYAYQVIGEITEGDDSLINLISTSAEDALDAV